MLSFYKPTRKVGRRSLWLASDLHVHAVLCSSRILLRQRLCRRFGSKDYIPPRTFYPKRPFTCKGFLEHSHSSVSIPLRSVLRPHHLQLFARDLSTRSGPIHSYLVIGLCFSQTTAGSMSACPMLVKHSLRITEAKSIKRCRLVSQSEA